MFKTSRQPKMKFWMKMEFHLKLKMRTIQFNGRRTSCTKSGQRRNGEIGLPGGIWSTNFVYRNEAMKRNKLKNVLCTSCES